MPNIYQSFTYKMAAKINWHRYGTKLRHCRPVYRGRRSNYHPETGTAVLVAYTAAASSSCGKAIFVRTRGMIWLALAGRPTALQATQHAVRRRRSSKHELRPFHRCTERVTRSVLRTGSPTDTTDSERSVGAVQMPTSGRLMPCSQHGNVTIWWGDVCAAKATVVQHQAS